ncbi:pyridoxamine kinase [Aeromonas salmonicida subsp. salmonicida A449]|uniref:pyridoxal kinase n=2 Tax=Aeromonas salmonicida subsp. salmonicida TaxID=29491 RepID=A4SN55_AERS4|nr:pyridoxamine kinase [Aeromonas salmonicida subsp. salmonicida A449]SPT74058.1 pyridoxamine kinase [Aeromonas salmonicida]SUU71294.1 pyridoxamine kinase [Aeromonas salmonicida]
MLMKRILSIQSHVVFGCAGNSAAVFPMRRLGMEVWPVNTVQFSNHTQYAAGWQGMAMPAGHISALVKGLSDIEVLGQCDAVLSGYLGSAEQGDEILAVVAAVKAANPNAVYFCDPVMGHPEKGCIVAPGVTRFLTEQALPVADIMAPNLLELETLCDTHLADLAQTRVAAHQLLATPEGDYLIARPLYAFARQPVGVGDLISALMLANLQTGYDAVTAFERTNAAVDTVMLHTWQAEAYELQLISAQDAFAEPVIKVRAERLA